MPGGRLLSDPASRTQLALGKDAQRQPAVAAEIATQTGKPRIPYVPAPRQPLARRQLTTTVTAHVSPDAGFTTLSTFLQGTRQSLVIGMYDLTSGPLLSLFETDLKGTRTLQMVLDNPALNPTADQTDSQTVQALDGTLGSRAHIVRALSRSDTFAAAWMFPSAYHIKVIVRDGSSLWLSSGNLNNSNQPDPAAPPQTEDRDWHILIEDSELSKLFAAYLDQDFTSASAHQAAPNPALGEAIAAARLKLAAETNPTPPQPFPTPAGKKAGKKPSGKSQTGSRFAPQTFEQVSVAVTPLLTPDNLSTDSTEGQYVTNMLQLINGAQKHFYGQLQYIESSSQAGDYQNLLQAIAARAAAGVDVRLIESLEYGEPWAEKMKTTGVDLTPYIALQPNVHNKGFVVDSSIAVLSSQNFSGEGVRTNRDAGVILENTAIAQYYETVFLSDWNDRAKPFVPPSKAVTKKSHRKK